MDIRQGKKITIKGEVTGTITALKGENKYRVKIGDQTIWVTDEDIAEVKEDE